MIVMLAPRMPSGMQPGTAGNSASGPIIPSTGRHGKEISPSSLPPPPTLPSPQPAHTPTVQLLEVVHDRLHQLVALRALGVVHQARHVLHNQPECTWCVVAWSKACGWSGSAPGSPNPTSRGSLLKGWPRRLVYVRQKAQTCPAACRTLKPCAPVSSPPPPMLPSAPIGAGAHRGRRPGSSAAWPVTPASPASPRPAPQTLHLHFEAICSALGRSAQEKTGAGKTQSCRAKSSKELSKS